jgi:hypothetical protein
MPQSSWPLLPEEQAALATPTVTRPARPLWRRVWWQPVIAAAATLLVAVVLLALIWNWLDRNSPRVQDRLARIRQQVQLGRQALRQGEFARAGSTLRQARQDAEALQARFPAAEIQHVRQLAQQAELLAELLDEPLERMIAQAHAPAAGLDWAAHFRATYQDRAVAFETPLEAEAARGGGTIDYLLVVPGTSARIDLANLELQPLLSSRHGERLFFGARLESLTLEKGDCWVVRFRQDSVVLLDEPGLARLWDIPEEPPEARRELSLAGRASCALLGLPVPDQVSRQVLSGSVREQWIYGKTATQRLFVERGRRPAEPH